MATSAMALLLADARLPDGSHAHSGGMEQATDDGVVTGLASLTPFLHGRLDSAGRLAAFVAARACALDTCTWTDLDAEVTARIVAPALRATSRRQGRALLRTGIALVSAAALAAVAESAPEGPHLAVVQGALARAAGLTPAEAALIAAYGTVVVAASAALRLLGLDPVSVTASLAALAPQIDRLVAEAAADAQGPARDLPAPGAPLTDLLGERHAAREERLFAS